MLFDLSWAEYLVLAMVAFLIFYHTISKMSDKNSSKYDFEDSLVTIGIVFASGGFFASFLLCYPLHRFVPYVTPKANAVVTSWIVCFGLSFVVIGIISRLLKTRLGKAFVKAIQAILFPY